MISLTRPVSDVQGCAFDTATRLLCSTNDPGTDLYAMPRQLLAVQLTRPVAGRPITGTPTLLGPVPGQIICPNVGEVEGLDVMGNRLSDGGQSSVRAGDAALHLHPFRRAGSGS